MPSPRTYTTAGAFRRGLEERLKRVSLTDQIDLNRLRRQVSFDRLLARLFREEPAPWVFEGWLCAGVTIQGCSINGGHRPDVAASSGSGEWRHEPGCTREAAGCG